MPHHSTIMSRPPLLLKVRPSTMSFYDLPDEIVIYILWFLDVDALLATAKVRRMQQAALQSYLQHSS